MSCWFSIFYGPLWRAKHHCTVFLGYNLIHIWYFTGYWEIKFTVLNSNLGTIDCRDGLRQQLLPNYLVLVEVQCTYHCAFFWPPSYSLAITDHSPPLVVNVFGNRKKPNISWWPTTKNCAFSAHRAFFLLWKYYFVYYSRKSLFFLMVLWDLLHLHI